MQNRFIANGRLAKNIELRYTSSNTAVAQFSLAVGRNYKNKEGNYDTDFINCISYKQLAETMAKYTKKGDLIGIDGRLQNRSYTTKEGTTKYITEIVVESIDFLQPKDQAEENKQVPKISDEIVLNDDLPF